MDLILEREPSKSKAMQGCESADVRSMLPSADEGVPGGADAAFSSSSRLEAFRHLVETTTLPLPASGRTLWRWRFLARVAARDLVLVKLFEAHADALAILADLDREGTILRAAQEQVDHAPAWGVWAAEPPDAQLHGRTDSAGNLKLSGRKAWCSGAAAITHALVTYRTADNSPALACVCLRDPGIEITGEGWHAVGMADTGSVDVCFDNVAARAVGAPGAYLQRPGFWHGGAGIAACWYGGVLPLADALMKKVAAREDPHALAHLGRIDYSLRQTRALMHETARAIDQCAQAHARARTGIGAGTRGDAEARVGAGLHAQPDAGSNSGSDAVLDLARAQALRLRAAVEGTVLLVIAAFGNALGAAPLCRDVSLAHRYADLPVFLRQSHAERDLAELGRLLISAPHEEQKWRI
jgi:hypothetical protein